MKRVLSVLLALCLLLAVPICAVAAGPAPSDNSRRQFWNILPHSFLYANEQGGLTRVERLTQTSRELIVEDYDSNFKLLNSRKIPIETPVKDSDWGTFFCGEKYNFVISGDSNIEESDDKEVVRVVKYSKDWERLDHLSICGANTVYDFDQKVSCVEQGGALYIHASHEMYKSGDGHNHQSNFMLQIDEENMTLIDSGVGFHPAYVSHSFEQFVTIDNQGRLVTTEVGDGAPLGLVITRFNQKAGLQPNMNGVSIDRVILDTTYHNNLYYSAWTGGIVCTDKGFIMPVSFFVEPTSYTDVDTEGIFLMYISDDFSITKKVKLNTTEDDMSNIAKIVPTSQTEGYVLWPTTGNSNAVQYVHYNSSGEVSKVTRATAPLSDCQPIYWNGKIVWYASTDTGEGDVIRFYTLDENGVKMHKVTASGWSDTKPTFPENDKNFDMAGGEIFSYLGTSRNVVIPNGVTAINNSAFIKNHDIDSIYIPASVDESSGWAGIGFNVFSPFTKKIDVYYGGNKETWDWLTSGKDNLDMLNMHYNSTSPQPPEPTVGDFTDVKASAFYAEPVVWAVNNGITAGVGGNRFAPGEACKREQIVTFLYRSKGSPAVSVTDKFTDMPKSGEFQRAISWAVEKGVTMGNGKDKFNTGMGCTRAEAMTFIWRANGKPEPKSTAAFSDMPSNQDFRKAISWAVENNITQGTGGSNFSPDRVCTRGEIVTFLYRAK